MSKHAELLAEARKLANTISHVDVSLISCVTDSAMLRTLADTIERQDEIITETAAACKTCDETMTQMLEGIEIGFVEPRSRLWNELYAARHLARRVAKLGEPKGDDDEERIADRATKCDCFVGRLKNDYTAESQPSPPPVSNAIAEMMAECNRHVDSISVLRRAAQTVVRAVDGRLPPPPVLTNVGRASLRDLWYELHREYEIPRGNPCSVKHGRWTWIKPHLDTLKRLIESDPPPPVEVEMQCEQRHGAAWTWECRIGGFWLTHLTRCYGLRENAISGGNAWLAALGAQLGVPLVAAWKEEE